MKTYQFQNKTTGQIVNIIAISLIEACNKIKGPNGLGHKLYGIK